MLAITTQHEALLDIAEKAKNLRLKMNLSRATLAKKAGVSEGSLKRFENTGEVSLSSLLKIAFAFDRMDDFENLFANREERTIEEIIATKQTRQRGRR